MKTAGLDLECHTSQENWPGKAKVIPQVWCFLFSNFRLLVVLHSCSKSSSNEDEQKKMRSSNEDEDVSDLFSNYELAFSRKNSSECLSSSSSLVIFKHIFMYFGILAKDSLLAKANLCSDAFLVK